MSSEGEAPRIRRPIGERVRDNFVHAFPLPTTPLDRSGDHRIGILLSQLRAERDRRARLEGKSDAGDN